MKPFLADLRGIAGIEAALMSALLILPIAAGIVDAATIITAWLRVNYAEHEAALYAWGNGGTVNTTAVKNAAVTAYGTAAPTATVSASNACYCLTTATSYLRGSASAVSCSSTCGSGQTLANYMTLTISASVTLPLPLPALSSPHSISTSSTVRLQ